MPNDETAQSTVLDAPDTSRSRRGFLRKVGATGFFGMTAMTAVTEAVSATETTDSSVREDRARSFPDGERIRVTETSEPTNDLGTQATRNRVTIEGIADFTYYTLYTTGDVYGGDSSGNGVDYILHYPNGFDYNGRTYYYLIDGAIYANNADVYRFYGYVAIPSAEGISYNIEDL
ncbi:hypothetical protein [Halocatena pleomorpha]|uniref:Uncharacterized protein n=1 Tax=Halocatena pleomorpha TaxID=1785090 RepID=A0A3P3R9B6_9EURY|nr:hypothetical protein [Halocatena pleomorpha]RRJ30061.1 hypothetical protein EIK79_10770 [Halocatena pleomorpha]